jgi:hypothetical protein
MKVWVPAQAAVSLRRRWELRPTGSSCIRWKTNYFNSPPGPAQAEFEGLLTEGSDTLSVIYGVTGDNGLMGTSGIQQDLNRFTSFSCNQATLTPGPACELHTHKLWKSDADANGDGDCHGHCNISHSDRDSDSHIHANGDSDSNVYANGDGDSNGYTNCDCAAEVYANATAASDAAAPTVGSVTN